MSLATFSGPVRSGTVRFGTVAQGRNVGLLVLNQAYDTGDVTGVTGATNPYLIANLPQGSYIQNIVIDALVAPTGGTATFTVGTASGGSQLLTTSAISAGGRTTAAPTAANLLAWQTSTSADTPIWININASATLTAGRFIVTIVYVQRLPDGTVAPTFNNV